MTKVVSDLAWLLLRVCGVCLFGKGIFDVLAAFQVLMVFGQLEVSFNYGDQMAEEVLPKMELNLFVELVRSGVLAALGLYLIIGGGLLHAVITRLPKRHQITSEPEATSQDSVSDSTQLMQKLYREFLRTNGVPTSAKMRHAAFRQWLADRDYDSSATT